MRLLKGRARLPLHLLAAAMIAAALAGPAYSAAGPASDPAFEKPAVVRHVRLGPADTRPISYKEIRCSYFSGIMVKEWDEREIGDKEISYVTAPGAAKPACRKAALPGERRLPVGDLTVYFLGYAAGAIFLADADGSNGTIGFYVFEPKTGRQRFTDSIKLESRFSTISADAEKLRLGYLRALTGPCSVVSEGTDCWAKIAQQVGLSGAAPDCAAGYAEAGRKFAEEACRVRGGDKRTCLAEQSARRGEWNKAPSVIAFDVTTEIAPDGSAVIRPTGGPAQCWPSD